MANKLNKHGIKIIGQPKRNKQRSNFRGNRDDRMILKLSVYNESDKYCYYCGIKLSLLKATIDHYIPLIRNGDNNMNNCVICCKLCNKLKADLSIENWREKFYSFYHKRKFYGEESKQL